MELCDRFDVVDLKHFRSYTAHQAVLIQVLSHSEIEVLDFAVIFSFMGIAYAVFVKKVK